MTGYPPGWDASPGLSFQESSMKKQFLGKHVFKSGNQASVFGKTSENI